MNQILMNQSGSNDNKKKDNANYSSQNDFANVNNSWQSGYDNANNGWQSSSANANNGWQSSSANVNNSWQSGYDNVNNSWQNNSYTNANYNNQNDYQNVSTTNVYAGANDNYKKTDIRKVIKIFSIILIFMGITLIGKSAYALTTNASKLKDNPVVSTDKMGKEVTIKIDTEYPIKEFSYKWNSGEETKIEGNQTVSISETIDIPNGNNVLKITVTDYYGNKTEYMKQYIYESTDTEKPTIEIAKMSGNKLKITAKDETKISYLTYSWNDEEQERVDATNDGDKEIVVEIDVIKGENKLYITAVDGEENKQSRSENIIATSKPSFTVSSEAADASGQAYVVVNASDEIGLKKIVVYIDGNAYDSGEDSIEQKEIQAKIPVSSGDHNISVVVTNTSGLETTKELSVSV